MLKFFILCISSWNAEGMWKLFWRFELEDKLQILSKIMIAE